LETEKLILEGLFSSILSQFKKYNPSGNMKFNNLGFFLGLTYFIGKSPSHFSSAKFYSKCFGLLWVELAVSKIRMGLTE